MGWVVMAALFLPRQALAHTPGLSLAELAVAADGHVDARLTFASREPLGTSTLSQEDLRAFVLDGVDVTAGGARCEPTYQGASPAEGDGLLLEASYACPAGATDVTATLYYLSALPRGHREIARIVGPPGSGAAAEGVLTGDHRALSLTLPAPAAPRHARLGARLLALTAVFAVLMVALFSWRWRAVRKRR
ncbi:MAG TPA: hypothetical protein VHS09_13040 [Polyangiaceae bacterium]|nr:hypothetical protein [Polyangiaceae bacterium]